MLCAVIRKGVTGGRVGPGSRAPLGSHPLDPGKGIMSQKGLAEGRGNFRLQGKPACDYRGGVFFFKEGRTHTLAICHTFLSDHKGWTLGERNFK